MQTVVTISIFKAVEREKQEGGMAGMGETNNDKNVLSSRLPKRLTFSADIGSLSTHVWKYDPLSLSHSVPYMPRINSLGFRFDRF